jgi:hypothetical protein
VIQGTRHQAASSSRIHLDLGPRQARTLLIHIHSPRERCPRQYKTFLFLHQGPRNSSLTALRPSGTATMSHWGNTRQSLDPSHPSQRQRSSPGPGHWSTPSSVYRFGDAPSDSSMQESLAEREASRRISQPPHLPERPRTPPGERQGHESVISFPSLFGESPTASHVPESIAERELPQRSYGQPHFHEQEFMTESEQSLARLQVSSFPLKSLTLLIITCRHIIIPRARGCFVYSTVAMSKRHVSSTSRLCLAKTLLAIRSALSASFHTMMANMLLSNFAMSAVITSLVKSVCRHG